MFSYFILNKNQISFIYIYVFLSKGAFQFHQFNQHRSDSLILKTTKFDQKCSFMPLAPRAKKAKIYWRTALSFPESRWEKLLRPCKKPKQSQQANSTSHVWDLRLQWDFYLSYLSIKFRCTCNNCIKDHFVPSFTLESMNFVRHKTMEILIFFQEEVVIYF